MIGSDLGRWTAGRTARRTRARRSTTASSFLFQFGSASLVCPTKLAHVSDCGVRVDI